MKFLWKIYRIVGKASKAFFYGEKDSIKLFREITKIMQETYMKFQLQILWNFLGRKYTGLQWKIWGILIKNMRNSVVILWNSDGKSL